MACFRAIGSFRFLWQRKLMKTLIAKLEAGEILVSDGAWGTMFQKMGLQAGECVEEWNISQPSQVRAVAAAYVAAGSEIILTNTFGGSSLKLKNYNLQNRTSEINRLGVMLSKEAAGAHVKVAASVGPTGKFLQPFGETTGTEMFDVFSEQISAQIAGGADAIIIETMSDLSEAIIAVKAAKSITTRPVLVTMTFEKGKQGYRTMMGVSVKEAVMSLTDNGVDMIGTNCGNGIEQICEIIAEIRKYTSKFVIAHPNAGMPKLIGTQTIFDQSPIEMAAYVPELIKAGANIIGGCCGTTPDHISAIVQQIATMRCRG